MRSVDAVIKDFPKSGIPEIGIESPLRMVTFEVVIHTHLLYSKATVWAFQVSVFITYKAQKRAITTWLTQRRCWFMWKCLVVAQILTFTSGILTHSLFNRYTEPIKRLFSNSGQSFFVARMREKCSGNWIYHLVIRTYTSSFFIYKINYDVKLTKESIFFVEMRKKKEENPMCPGLSSGEMAKMEETTGSLPSLYGSALLIMPHIQVCALGSFRTSAPVSHGT